MANLTIKTKGLAPKNATSYDFSTKEIADAIKFEINGKKASVSEELLITKEFIESHNIIANFTSGTFLGFSFKESAEDAFESLIK